MLVDFNLAYNPYCAYNEDWYCPITPPENRLKVAIRAGERLFPDPVAASPRAISALDPNGAGLDVRSQAKFGIDGQVVLHATGTAVEGMTEHLARVTKRRPRVRR